MDQLLFPVSLTRVALRPFTFSNGVTVPAGTQISVPSVAVHTDGEIYPNPKKFDGFRFAQLRERNGVTVAGQQATSTSSEYFAFGYGRNAWCVLFIFILSQPVAVTHIPLTALVASLRPTRSRPYLHISL
jgi:hypothetical protein